MSLKTGIFLGKKTKKKKKSILAPQSAEGYVCPVSGHWEHVATEYLKSYYSSVCTCWISKTTMQM